MWYAFELQSKMHLIMNDLVKMLGNVLTVRNYPNYLSSIFDKLIFYAPSFDWN